MSKTGPVGHGPPTANGDDSAWDDEPEPLFVTSDPLNDVGTTPLITPITGTDEAPGAAPHPFVSDTNADDNDEY